MREKDLKDPSLNFKASLIYWLLKDKTFYSECLKIFRQKDMFDQTLWQHSIYHHDVPTIKEFLSSRV